MSTSGDKLKRGSSAYPPLPPSPTNIRATAPFSIATNVAYFSKTNARSNADILADMVIVPKIYRGAPGSREFNYNYYGATKAIIPLLGAAKHFVADSQTGEPDTANESKNASLQETFVGNALKIKKLEHRLWSYDMMDCILIPTLVDKDAIHPQFKYGDRSTRLNLLEHASRISLDRVIAWQYDTNEYSEVDAESSKWLDHLLVASSTDELNIRVTYKIELLPLKEQGGVVRLKLMLDKMFFMSAAVVSALQEWIKQFAVAGPSKTPGENIAICMQQFLACSTRLAENLQLPSESSAHLLEGLTKCSVELFSKPFDNMLQQERMASLTRNVLLEDDSRATLKRIQHIAKLANTSYHTLCTSGMYNLPGGAARTSFNFKCFNCGGFGHGVRDCKKKKDQAKIDENKKKFVEAKKAEGGGASFTKRSNNSKSNKGKKKKAAKNSGNQAPTKPGESNGVHMVNGKFMCKCNKGCGLNMTHTSGFHDAWALCVQNNVPFALPASHKFSEVNPSVGGTSLPVASGGTLPSTPAQGGLHQMGVTFAAQHNVRTKAVLEKHKNSVDDPNLSSLLADLQTAWNLN